MIRLNTEIFEYWSDGDPKGMFHQPKPIFVIGYDKLRAHLPTKSIPETFELVSEKTGKVVGCKVSSKASGDKPFISYADIHHKPRSAEWFVRIYI